MSTNTDVLLEEWKSLRQETDGKKSFIERLVLTTITGNFIIYSFAFTLQGITPLNALIALLPVALTAMAYFWILRTLYSGQRITKYIAERIEPATGLGWEASLWRPRRMTQDNGRISWREDVFELFYRFFLLNSVLISVLLILLPYWPFTNVSQAGAVQLAGLPFLMSVVFAGVVMVVSIAAILVVQWLWIGPRVNDIVRMNNEIYAVKEAKRHGEIKLNGSIVAGFGPQWKPYKGVALCFDNPGSKTSGIYQAFTEIFDELDPYMLANVFSLYLLPSRAYHVVVWQGINEENVNGIGSRHRKPIMHILEGLPKSILEPNPIVERIHRSFLDSSGCRQRCTLRFDKLAMWDGCMLVAELIADNNSSLKMAEIEKAQTVLATDIETEFGLSIRSRVRPYVILGYFVNETLAQLAVPHFDSWTKRLAVKIGGSDLELDPISLYAHTDAATWFKASDVAKLSYPADDVFFPVTPA